MRFALGLLLSAVTLSPAYAAEWVVDPAQSELTFTASDGGKPFTGKFASFEAKIEYDATALDAASVDVTIPLSGMDAGSAERNDELQKEDWFNPKVFPVARYTAKGFTLAERSDPPSLIANGTLTLRDISQPVMLQFRLEPNGESIIATGTAMVDRSAFKLGLKDYPAGGSIGTAVQVNFKLVANKKP
jgi:polyisoprenoid-binding protein YceI